MKGLHRLRISVVIEGFTLSQLKPERRLVGVATGPGAHASGVLIAKCVSVNKARRRRVRTERHLTRSIDLRSPGPRVMRLAFGDFPRDSASCGAKGSPRPHRTRKYSPGAPLTIKVPCSLDNPLGRVKARPVDGSAGISVTDTRLNGAPPFADNTRPVRIDACAITTRTSLISAPAVVLSLSRRRSVPLS